MNRTAFADVSRTACCVAVLAGLFVACSGITASAEDQLSRVGPGDVKLGGEIGRRIDVTIQNNLLKLKLDEDFLNPFRQRKAKEGFTGLGMLLDAAVRLAAYSGDPRVVDLKRRLVHETLKTQEADGYIGMLEPKSRMWALWDIHEMGYIIYGLTSDFKFFHERGSLDGARKLADYILARWTAEPQREVGDGITTHMSVTGLERTLLTLAAATGDRRYSDFCTGQRKLREWDLQIVRGRWGLIEGHAYAYLGHALAQLQLYRTEPDERLLRTTRRAMDFLTRRDGLVISGTCGDHECWHDTQSGTTNLGETCTVAYLLRTLDDLLRLEGDNRYGDLMERAIFNALFAAQSPDGRRIRYYTPFECTRTYFPADTYCCPNNYRRVVSELPTMVYYLAPRELTVNLYTASTAKVDLGNGLSASVRQETDYPTSGKVLLKVDPPTPAEFTVRLRIPRWCQGAKIAVNGQPVAEPVRSGSYGTISRKWLPGDRVELDLPMPLRLVRGRQSQAGRVALMRGPVVFCLSQQRNPVLHGIDPRVITLVPSSLEGPTRDDSVRPGGTACSVEAWKPGTWYPSAKPELRLVLTEFADPSAEFAYFHIPDPNAKDLADDELADRGP
jgi:uncharacterized protein